MKFDAKKVHFMKTLSILVLVVGAACLIGCQRGLTPELSGISNRPADADNMERVTGNQNWRMISDDWYRIWYVDHPSRLSSYPIQYTSGMPR